MGDARVREQGKVAREAAGEDLPQPCELGEYARELGQKVRTSSEEKRRCRMFRMSNTLRDREQVERDQLESAAVEYLHEVDGSCVHNELIGLVSLHRMGEYALLRRTVTKQNV